MSAGHASRLYVSRSSPIHRLPAQTKLVAVLTFVLVVVSTPRGAYWAFGAYALLLAAVTVLSRIPFSLVLRRMTIEIPFVIFALLIPFVAEGDRTQFLGVSVSVTGVHAMLNILAKATIGVAASVLLAATTDLREILVGLQRLKMPSVMVQIAAFMLRYTDVIAAELERMRIARESRGFVARDVRQLRVVAAGAGSMFIRSYERGERVHLAMLSRGYSGSMPLTGSRQATARDWLLALTLPGLAAAVVVAAWWAM